MNPASDPHPLNAKPTLQSASNAVTMRILLRAGKDPLRHLSPEEIVLNAPTAGLFGKNAGNMMFQDAMHQILSTPTTTVTVDQLRTERGYSPFPVEPFGPTGRTLPSIRRTADAINDQFDMLVLPLANAFRASLSTPMERLTEIIKHLKIPVVVAGVGFQRKFANANKPLDPAIAELAKNFATTVLDHSQTLGVRGAITRDILNQLGIPENRIDVIGCPSLFANGADLHVDHKLERIEPNTAFTINISPYVKRMNAFALSQASRFPNMTYVPQIVDDLKLMLWAEEPAVRKHNNTLQTRESPYYRESRMKFFVDSRSWIDYLTTQSFSIGSRIHGNIAALRAGTPALVVAHDTRTLEIAEYHDIPHVKISAIKPKTTVEELYERTDFAAFNSGHAARFEHFKAFLDRNGVPNRFAEGGGTGIEKHERSQPRPNASYAEALNAVPKEPAITVRFPSAQADDVLAQSAKAEAVAHHTEYLSALGRLGRPTLTKRFVEWMRNRLRKAKG